MSRSASPPRSSRRPVRWPTSALRVVHTGTDASAPSVFAAIAALADALAQLGIEADAQAALDAAQAAWLATAPQNV